jgi:hypothetical protein
MTSDDMHTAVDVLCKVEVQPYPQRFDAAFVI